MSKSLANKFPLFVVFLLLIFSKYSIANNSENGVNLKHELTYAAKSKKLLIVILEASWCDDSKALNLYLQDDNVQRVVSNSYHLIRLTEDSRFSNFQPLFCTI